MNSQGATRDSRLVFWTALLLFPLLFVVDAATPRGVVVCIAYEPVVCLALWLRGQRSVFILAAVATVLALVGACLKAHSAVTLVMLISNRMLSVATMWWIATAVYVYRVAEGTHRQTLASMRREVDAKQAILASVVEFSEDAILIKSLDGIIGTWNRGAERLFGYTAEEAIGQSVLMLVPQELRRDEAAIFARLVQGQAVEQLDTVRTHKNGRRMEVSITLLPVKNILGKVISASATVREIGKRKGTEAMLAAVVDNAIDGLISIDGRGNVESFNRSCQKIFDYSEEEVIGRNIRMLMPEPYHGEYDGHLLSFNRSGEAALPGTSTREVSGRRKDGSVFPMEFSVSAFQLSGTRHFSGIIRDITDKKKAEAEAVDYTRALLQSNQALDEFAYAASHDLKAPLRVIDNASRWLEEDLAEHLTGDMRENMQLLRGRVKRMEKLLDDLLAYSRIGRKTDAEFAEAVSGDDLMQDVLALVPRVPGFTIAVSPSFADIKISRMPLQQILANLVGNAIKHHDRADGRISVSVEPGDPMLAFSVADDGPGIAPQFHDRIFSMFQTLKPRDQVEGSGMGLAMVRKYVEVFGGSIWIESAEGRGSTFKFTWPARQPRLGQLTGRQT